MICLSFKNLSQFALIGLLLFSSLAAAIPPASVAVFYGDNPPWDELHAFDVVVVEPLHVPDPKPFANQRTALFAYVSLGEADPDRPHVADIPAAWQLGKNTAWGSTVLDQTQPGWPDFFVERVIKPLWDAGYRDFFLDTLDSYQLYAKTAEERSRQEAGLIATIRTLKQRYPQARLIFNRGFEILPQVHDLAYAVAAESLFHAWNPAQQKYQPVADEDRAWLLEQLDVVRREYQLPVLVIDYVAPEQRDIARETAGRIRELGFIPWVSNPELNLLGVGEVEVMPRKVLMIHNSADTEFDLKDAKVLRFATMPLNYLGYSAEYLDARRPLPGFPLNGRYAGIIVWLDNLPGREGGPLARWLVQQIKSGVPVALLGETGFLFNSAYAAALGLKISEASPTQSPLRVAQAWKASEAWKGKEASPTRSPLRVTRQVPMAGFETLPMPDRSAFFPLSAMQDTPLLTLTNAAGEEQTAISLTAWGGYAMDPYVLTELLAIEKNHDGKNLRWIFDPIEFFRLSLKLPDMPVPDVTTESGRRMLMVHIDGDGFASKAEFPGSPYAAEILIERILKKYSLPTTISIIQGEIAPNGLYPAQSAILEQHARNMFALPHIEIASHSSSHPFFWQKAQGEPENNGYHLAIPGYTLDLDAEITGSIRYIESRLAPPGKPVKTFLWSGDTNPGIEAMSIIQKTGVINMNGGDTLITRSFPTLTMVAPLGIPKGKYFQVYAPNQNEYVYTNNWQGPFYGYERAIETFLLTETPLRLKPIDIYYHTYSASKQASLRALDKVYAWALTQETTPVHVSAYVNKVLDFNRVVVARTHNGWRVRGAEHLRELRAPASLGQPMMDPQSGLAGFNRHGKIQYLHLASDEADIHFTETRSARFGPSAQSVPPTPYLVSANARVTSAQLGRQTLKLALTGAVPLKFSLAMGPHCSVKAEGKTLLAASRTGNISHFSVRQHAIGELRVLCAQ